MRNTVCSTPRTGLLIPVTLPTNVAGHASRKSGVHNANCYQAYENIMYGCFDTDENGKSNSAGTWQSSRSSSDQWYWL